MKSLREKEKPMIESGCCNTDQYHRVCKIIKRNTIKVKNVQQIYKENRNNKLKKKTFKLKEEK